MMPSDQIWLQLLYYQYGNFLFFQIKAFYVLMAQIYFTM